jgi:hypothetical protein
MQPFAENFYCGDKAVPLAHHEVHVIEVLSATEAMRKTVAWIDCRSKLSGQTKRKYPSLCFEGGPSRTTFSPTGIPF